MQIQSSVRAYTHEIKSDWILAWCQINWQAFQSHLLLDQCIQFEFRTVDSQPKWDYALLRKDEYIHSYGVDALYRVTV